MPRLDDEEYEIPLVDQRYFGAGIKRKRIKFVPPASSVPTESLPAVPSTSVADRYRRVVLEKSGSKSPPEPRTAETCDSTQDASVESSSTLSADPESEETICEICRRPITEPNSVAAHHSSIAHQICLQHSHPPSHVDRRRKGLAVLESQGWDPDSRKGLGMEGQGITYPIKATENLNRAGLGMKSEVKKAAAKKPVGLDAGKIRLLEDEGKKRASRLRQAFYGSDDVARYLGE